MCTCTWAQAEANIDDLDVLVLVRPNNPDGGVVGAGRLADVARRLAARGGWLVIDEAFADPGDAGAAAGGDILPLNVIRPIARAPCRERVCQYVYILVVPVSF